MLVVDEEVEPVDVVVELELEDAVEVVVGGGGIAVDPNLNRDPRRVAVGVVADRPSSWTEPSSRLEVSRSQPKGGVLSRSKVWPSSRNLT